MTHQDRRLLVHSKDSVIRLIDLRMYLTSLFILHRFVSLCECTEWSHKQCFAYTCFYKNMQKHIHQCFSNSQTCRSSLRVSVCLSVPAKQCCSDTSVLSTIVSAFDLSSLRAARSSSAPPRTLPSTSGMPKLVHYSLTLSFICLTCLTSFTFWLKIISFLISRGSPILLAAFQ